ncbi:MAG TPA: outer membrane protein [Xanthobacteraceae bacterium]|nr:outer membrane protein [Xanthobacteraceae bacterium]
MKRMLYRGLMVLAAAAVASSAQAADLSPGYGSPYYKAPTYSPGFGWGGFYLGLNGGGGWGRSTWDRAGEFDLSGGVFGGTAGFGWQFGQVLLGIEGDVDWSGMSGSTAVACPAGCSTQNNWLGTVRGRVGYAFDRILPYITGGIAAGDISASTPGFAGASQTNLGWALGAGVEVAVYQSWSIKAEYLHVDLGSFNCALACGLNSADNVSFDANLLRGGVNYHF